MTSLPSHSSSNFVGHEPCPKCGSKDNLGRYSDGHGYCYGCQYSQQPDSIGEVEGVDKSNSLPFIQGTIKALPKRGLTQATCKVWRYEVGHYKGRACHIANYFDEAGCKIGQKLRFEDKTFKVIGNLGSKALYGKYLWSSGKMVVVTEGEIDALSMSQAFDNKWPVVSIPNGVQSAYKCLQENLEWFNGFERVVLLFDQDEAGIKAAQSCAQLFKVGHVFIGRLPLKDANEMLVATRGSELINAIWRASEYRPDGIVDGKDTWKYLLESQGKPSAAYPFEGLNSKTGGIRLGEIVTICAGTGIGKSQACREIALHLVTQGFKVGYIALEENLGKTVASFIHLKLNQPPHSVLEANDATKTVWEEIIPKMAFYDHFGSMDSTTLLNRIRFMAVSLNCKHIILDHLSIVISGLAGGDERRMIDQTMTNLRSLVEELQISLILVSHLRRIDGKPHEEGGVTSLSHLRGSGGVAQLSDMVIGLERDQQSEASNYMTLRVLKNRFKGETGFAATLEYDPTTGRLSEVSAQASETSSVF
ncbi:MAG: toprim domain-containing protein [Alphaproteobacteria bacterium]|nr:toprim domain-containing protein [Alphaproteobacteria bacterium]OJV45206.1 MAG: hypothetical protein BGO28_00175 [Alphaproteobacteria bacterium 43-37]